MQFDRRGLMKTGAAAIAAPYLWLPARADEPQWPTQTVAPFIEVDTAAGRIRGGHSRGALAFKAIPYAGSVSGKNRFKAAPKVTPWTGVKDCTRLGPPSLQNPGTTYGEHEPAYSEDCLVLNVWTPAVKDGGKRPVMFFCHGGGFTTGSGGQNIADGSRLAATYDVVVVGVNHRLGLLGFLYLGELGGAEYATSGNQSLLDIVAALGWVKENIATFGGDPGNVMVFGESGGGAKTCGLLAMPTAQPLIAKGGVMSGPMVRAMPKDAATETARRFLAGLGIGSSELGKLADVPADKIIAMQMAAEKGQGPLHTPSKEWAAGKHPPADPMRGDPAGNWAPVVDGTYMPRDPFNPDAPAAIANVPLLIGNTRDEAVFFQRENPAFFNADEAGLKAVGRQFFGDAFEPIYALYKHTRPQATPAEIGIAIQTAVSMGNDSTLIADRKSVQPAPVYRYRYDYQSNVPVKGTNWIFRAGHASDISMFFYNYEFKDLQGDGPGLAEASKAMSGYFTSFAHNAAPKAAGQPDWPRYNTTDRPVMLINTKCEVVNDPDGEERKFWQSIPH